MTQTPAGWYPDPESAEQQRYWDGAQWTEHRAPAQPAYQPPSYPDPAQQGHPYQAPPKSNTTRNVLIVIGVLLLLLVGGCFAVVGLAAKGINDAVEKSTAPHDVTYRLSGTATSATVTYTDGRLSTASEETVDVPFEKELTIDGSVFSVYTLSASKIGEGSLTCEILVDGKSVDTETTGEDALGYVLCDYSK